MKKQSQRLIESLFLALAILSGGCSAPTTSMNLPTVVESPLLVEIPYSETPTIDGIITEGEWSAASTELFAEGSELLLMRDTDYLYLAIRSSTDEMIAANIYTEENGEIIIRHASAALGTAIYQPGDSAWLKVQDFQWQCRATNNSTTAKAEREIFLEIEDWLAANSRMGTPNELEYQIKIKSDTLPLAASFMRSSEPDIRIYFPIDLIDDTIQSTPDGLPETRKFIPEVWLLLDLKTHQ